jgi:hypothetical protein
MKPHPGLFQGTRVTDWVRTQRKRKVAVFRNCKGRYDQHEVFFLERIFFPFFHVLCNEFLEILFHDYEV